MGLMDIVKKLLTGATDEENARNKARMRELFNECVPEGDQYTLIYCHMEDFTDAVVVKVTTHSNFIVHLLTPFALQSTHSLPAAAR